MYYLSAEDILYIHFRLIEDYGGSHGVRDENRLKSVIEAPKQEAFGKEQYSSIFDKAAVYARNIISDHLFVDGNKRCGMTSASVFLMKNGYELTASQKQLEDFAVQIAVEKCDILEIAEWFKCHAKKTKQRKKKMIIYFTDGSCSPNPGPGGFSVVSGGRPVVLGGEKDSTNIRMEGEALIAAMKHADGEKCEIKTDSEFWIKVITEWSIGWEAKGWKKSKGEIKNLDLVKAACALYKTSQVKLTWVKAHVGHDGNELADEWANKARKGATI